MIGKYIFDFILNFSLINENLRHLFTSALPQAPEIISVNMTMEQKVAKAQISLENGLENILELRQNLTESQITQKCERQT